MDLENLKYLIIAIAYGLMILIALTIILNQAFGV